MVLRSRIRSTDCHHEYLLQHYTHLYALPITHCIPCTPHHFIIVQVVSTFTGSRSKTMANITGFALIRMDSTIGLKSQSVYKVITLVGPRRGGLGWSNVPQILQTGGAHPHLSNSSSLTPRWALQLAHRDSMQTSRTYDYSCFVNVICMLMVGWIIVAFTSLAIIFMTTWQCACPPLESPVIPWKELLLWSSPLHMYICLYHYPFLHLDLPLPSEEWLSINNLVCRACSYELILHSCTKYERIKLLNE